MLVRFDLRPDHAGWSIIDRTTGRIATLGRFVPQGLSRKDADELADLLNTLQFLKRGRVVH